MAKVFKVGVKTKVGKRESIVSKKEDDVAVPSSVQKVKVSYQQFGHS